MSIDWTAEAGRKFHKMSGSGNDFVFFDCTARPAGSLASPEAIQVICARATGVGADGVVFLEPRDRFSSGTAFRMRYHNSDGSRAEMCGNAALCSTRLAVELGIADAAGFCFDSDSGVVQARMRNGRPEIDLPPIDGLRVDAELRRVEGEGTIGFARVGVPHLVVSVRDLTHVAVERRGRELRSDTTLRDGANVNFIAPDGGAAWRMRTYERGVEAETLACGTGAVACAAMLAAWGLAREREVVIMTSSGKPLRVRLPATPNGGPSLSGEGRIVFYGAVAELV